MSFEIGSASMCILIHIACPIRLLAKMTAIILSYLTERIQTELWHCWQTRKVCFLNFHGPQYWESDLSSCRHQNKMLLRSNASLCQRKPTTFIHTGAIV